MSRINYLRSTSARSITITAAKVAVFFCSTQFTHIFIFGKKHVLNGATIANTQAKNKNKGRDKSLLWGGMRFKLRLTELNC